MRLQDYLVETEQVSARDVADAERRAIIYGGSIDTALLELEVIDPEALDAALAGARGLLASPPELLAQQAQNRPWELLPSAWISAHEAVPLAMIEDRLWVALHPEVTDEAIVSVQQQLPGAALTVTAECWIRVIAEQQGRTTPPPRYSALAADYIQALRRARGHLAEDSLTREVAEIHQTFSDVSGGFLIVDDDGLEDSLHDAPLLQGESPSRGERPQDEESARSGDFDVDIDIDDLGGAGVSDSSAELVPDEPPDEAPDEPPDEPQRAPDEAAPGATGSAPSASGVAEERAESPGAESRSPEDPAEGAPVQAAQVAQAAPSGDDPGHEPGPEASATTSAPTESPTPAEKPFVPVIPGLRRAAVEPETSDAPDPEHALGESPPFIPALVQESAEEPPPTPVLPSLRGGPDGGSAVIPQLQRPATTIPSLTRAGEPPGQVPEDRSSPAAPSSAFIPSLQRSPTAPKRPKAEPEPDAPAPRTRREPSSGYVPATLVHRQAQSTTIDALLSSAIAAGGRREDHTERLRELGEAALVRIAQLFPGPLDLPRGDLKSLPTASAHGPLLRLCIALGAEVTPYILARLGDPDANVRFYVALVFQELRAPDAVGPLARLAFDDDRDVRTIAMRVLETYHGEPSYARAVQGLRGELQNPDPMRRQRAIRAMGTLRDVESLGALIPALDDDLEIAAAALTALCSISGQHLGMTSARWTAWLEANGSRTRIDWMIDSLEHRDPAVRRWAAEELHRVTGQRLDFDPSAEEPIRAAGVERWRAWALQR